MKYRAIVFLTGTRCPFVSRGLVRNNALIGKAEMIKEDTVICLCVGDMRTVLTVLILWGAVLCAVGMAADEYPFWDDEALLAIDIELLQSYLPADVVEALDQVTEAEWQTFWSGVETALQSQDMDDLAWILPEVETALQYLESMPEGSHYAHWLRARLDYFVVADEMARRIPCRLPADMRPVRTNDAALTAGRPSIAVPAWSKSVVVPIGLARKRSTIARNVDSWKRRLVRRAPPAGAAVLVPRLKTVFSAAGVPEALVWIAEVESTLDPEAESPAGAKGLFQLMPGTAAAYGLRTSLPDERMDPEKCARAAAHHLAYLYRKFSSWYLVLAAYNAGEGLIGRTLQKRNARTFEEIAVYLPVQTQLYVPKVMATIALREKTDPHVLPPPAPALPR